MKDALKKLLFVSFLFFISSQAVFAQKRVVIAEKFLKFKANDDFTEITITGFTDNAAFTGKVIEIPSKIQGMPVTAICGGIEDGGFGAFCEKGRGVEGIWVPSSVKRIGENAFLRCAAKTVHLSEGIEVIENSAFYASEMRSINLPSSLKDIGYSAFSFCHNLSSITFPAGIAVGGGNFAFSALKTVTLPNGPITLDGSFAECDMIENVIIPEGLVCYSRRGEGTLADYFNNSKLQSNIALQKKLRAVKVLDINKIEAEERAAKKAEADAKQLESIKEELDPFATKYNALMEEKNYSAAMELSKTWGDAAEKWSDESYKEKNDEGRKYSKASKTEAQKAFSEAQDAQKQASEAKGKAEGKASKGKGKSKKVKK